MERIVLTVHQRGLMEEVINPDDVSTGAEVKLKKTSGVLSDYLITAYIGDKALGYVSEIPMYLIDGTQILTEELYKQLPDCFEGSLEKKMSRTTRNNVIFSIKLKI